MMLTSRPNALICTLALIASLGTAAIFSTMSSTHAAAPAPAPSALPTGVEKQTFVLVHGAYAGGFEWKKAGDLLASHGHTVYRPTLTGNGEREHLSNTDIDINT